MEYELQRHPHSPAPPVARICASVTRYEDRLTFGYRIEGDMSDIVMPVLVPTERADDLWRTTCFEAFLGMPESSNYLEFNFSPSARWAGYAFDDYRAGRRDIVCASLPRFDMRAGMGSFTLSVILDLSDTKPRWLNTDLRLGLSAVIETKDRQKSYWAIAHPPGERPDFHHGDCFAGLLRAPDAA